MNCANIAVLDLSKQTAKDMGKKHSEGDFTPYSYKSGQNVLCAYEPTLYPDKIQPLLYSLGMADAALLVVGELTPELGEMIVALDAWGGPGYVVFTDDSKEKVAPLLKGTSIEKYRELSGSNAELRDLLAAEQFGRKGGDTKIVIDQCFNVKSVGTVVLGVVKRGKVAAHDDLELAPAGKQVNAKSLQVQDEDVKEAEEGSRVGVCLKGADVSEISRGHVLAKPGTMKTSKEAEIEVSLSKYSKAGMRDGVQFFAFIGMQYAGFRSLGNIEPGKSGRIKISFEKPVAHEPGENFMIISPESKPRVIGKGRLP
jgi:selenocysteine-specific translation elongation factor